MRDKLEEELNEYERQCDEIRKVNNGYLKLFEKSLSGLSAKTIRRHMDNADFYLNDYLLLHEPLPMENGLSRIFGFLDDYYIRKCFATEETWKEMASSIKKFYRCMRDYGKITEGVFSVLCDNLKEIADGMVWEEESAF